MRSIHFIFLFFLLAVYSHSNISAQTSESTVKTFDKDGLKFSYPSDWTITDKSSKETQYLLLSKENTTVLISVVSPRVFIQSQEQFRDIQNNTFNAYVKAISKSLSSPNKPAEQEYLCLDFNGRNVSGTKFVGFYNNEPSKGEIYPFVLGNRFLALTYMRIDKDAAKTDSIWQELIKSLYLEGSNKETAGLFFKSDVINEGILNSKAVKLVRPPYSKAYRDAGASGVVTVEVVIDENGKVVSAKALSGNKLLHKDAEYAARKSKFTPTMQCGTPIKVGGIIVYTFSP